MQIRDRVFVVTGGGNGIGRDVVLELLVRGARVAAIDLRTEALDGTRALADAYVDRLTTHTVDVSDRAAVEALVTEVTAAHGRVDGVANVAGIIQKFVPFADLPYDEMNKVLDVNYWGVVHMCKAFLPELLSRPEASLLNVSSMGAFVPVPGQSVYGASKAAVKLLTEGLYAELRMTKVAVTLVFPGAVRTGIAENSGAAIPGRSTDASVKITSSAEAARRIVDAIEKGTFRVCIGKDATMLDLLARLMPRRSIEFLAKKMGSLVER
ncbi:SDR family NAD(P)-dependent oxidoreductase [Rhodococcus pyridinivorans]|uniref:SDR family NAD(P)-dependent oxidoreductase n=1 Tax=Rhodococcus pyridinivorans TaxID=103816 RepID=A0A7M2XJY1_9NOCA|nr:MULTISPECIES: SDR family NAD(P)-dependent oxidoreductase [Rhodococcus]MCD5421648.1 SDR family NAD(P)-dependent oxidoreductase [Rhodococcus pyridinivorans]QOV98025.1 SDR family NAD(P)-dependent oxidoreductase [Rhodococcus pyridinivorans]QXU52925.1 SDR family NAD(P)-dependent oxidoreductase [Rhodococcus sp. LW-XY12]UPW05936.1 SDR family NAD(P)-dependent oxidoreductase [Rhodococcus pyridinivorans]WMM71893.1 SDR family NAD(P)-dependent oxidoreductase [Rhodococcus pyridinivorans]